MAASAVGARSGRPSIVLTSAAVARQSPSCPRADRGELRGSRCAGVELPYQCRYGGWTRQPDRRSRLLRHGWRSGEGEQGGHRIGGGEATKGELSVAGELVGGTAPRQLHEHLGGRSGARGAEGVDGGDARLVGPFGGDAQQDRGGLGVAGERPNRLQSHLPVRIFDSEPPTARWLGRRRCPPAVAPHAVGFRGCRPRALPAPRGGRDGRRAVPAHRGRATEWRHRGPVPLARVPAWPAPVGRPLRSERPAQKGDRPGPRPARGSSCARLRWPLGCRASPIDERRKGGRRVPDRATGVRGRGRSQGPAESRAPRWHAGAADREAPPPAAGRCACSPAKRSSPAVRPPRQPRSRRGPARRRRAPKAAASPSSMF